MSKEVRGILDEHGTRFHLAEVFDSPSLEVNLQKGFVLRRQLRSNPNAVSIRVREETQKRVAVYVLWDFGGKDEEMAR